MFRQFLLYIKFSFVVFWRIKGVTGLSLPIRDLTACNPIFPHARFRPIILGSICEQRFDLIVDKTMQVLCISMVTGLRIRTSPKQPHTFHIQITQPPSSHEYTTQSDITGSQNPPIFGFDSSLHGKTTHISFLLRAAYYLQPLLRELSRNRAYIYPARRTQHFISFRRIMLVILSFSSRQAIHWPSNYYIHLLLTRSWILTCGVVSR